MQADGTCERHTLDPNTNSKKNNLNKYKTSSKHKRTGESIYYQKKIV